MSVYVRTKFQVSNIFLTQFRQGLIPPPKSKRTPKKPTKAHGQIVITSELGSVPNKQIFIFVCISIYDSQIVHISLFQIIYTS